MDVLGCLLAIVVHAANIHDTKGGISAAKQAYELGKAVSKDCREAMKCYELGLQDPGEVGCANRSGRLYFLRKDGIPQDYPRAVQLLEQARATGKNTWGCDILGICYLFGYGCQKDPARALQLFRETDHNSDLLNYGLGTIYTEGLSVPQDIKKGVEYLQKAKGYAPAQEALLHFKKTLFGKWVRRWHRPSHRRLHMVQAPLERRTGIMRGGKSIMRRRGPHDKSGEGGGNYGGTCRKRGRYLLSHV